MTDHNDSEQELSAAQNDENDNGCPLYDRPIRSVTRRGPSNGVFAPCGHNVASTLPGDFSRGKERADVEFPECANCGASTWRLKIGEPTSEPALRRTEFEVVVA